MHKRILKWLTHRKRQRLVILLLLTTLCLSLIIGFSFHHDSSFQSKNRRGRYTENDRALQLMMNNKENRDVKKGIIDIEKQANKIQPLKTFICDSGKRIFNISVVNDDYCDCQDSSDEPLTSACVDSKFECFNKERIIPSSYVHDGICDCCDGSDEQGNSNPRLFVVPKHPIVNYAPCKYTCGT